MKLGPHLPTREAHTKKLKALSRLREEGASSVPLIFGSHRRSKAVVIPFDLYACLLPSIEELEITDEELEIAELILERSGEAAHPMSELAGELGLEPGDYR